MSAERAHALSSAYVSKDDSYYSNARSDYVDLLPTGAPLSILELGCGNGATGHLALQTGKAHRYVGIELMPEMASRAKDVLTEVHQGDVETLKLPYESGTFDGLILSEVLEHLTDPERVLRNLVQTLKPGAIVLASSPNIGHWKNILELVKGRFDYTESGMMDRTHLHWFTPQSFTRMFENAGVSPVRVAPLNPLRRFEKIVNKTRFSSTVYYQINFHGRYTPEGLT